MKSQVFRWVFRSGRALACLAFSGSLAGCQSGLVPNQQIPECGAKAAGWVQDLDALVLIEAFDHCTQDWREVTRAQLDAQPASLGRHRGHAWRAQLIPSSFASAECLFTPGSGQGQQDLSLRVKARRAESESILPSLAANAAQCLMDAPWQEQSAAELLAGCESSAQLPLVMVPSCPAGQGLRTQVVPLQKGGNLRRLKEPGTSSQPALMYHFEDSLLVGRQPPALGMDREFRNYLLFDRPALPSNIQGAWVSWFSNFETTLCAHREDMGCGFASEDSHEDFRLSLVDLKRHADPRTMPYGLAQDPAPYEALFSAMQQGTEAGGLRMQSQDVDRWFEIPLNRRAVDTLNAMPAGQTLMVAGRVARDFNETKAPRRELLFVDHLLNTSITSELEPRLNLLYCAPE